MDAITRAAIKAAAEFLEDDEKRDLLGLHKLRVGKGGELMTRGQLAVFLQSILLISGNKPSRFLELEDRVKTLEDKVSKLDHRTVRMIQFGGGNG